MTGSIIDAAPCDDALPACHRTDCHWCCFCANTFTQYTNSIHTHTTHSKHIFNTGYYCYY